MLELLARPIPVVSWKEAPAVWDQGWWNMACCPAPPGPQGPLKAGVQLSWLARQAGIMGMTQPKWRLTSSTQRGGRSSSSTQHSGSMATLPELKGQLGCQLRRLPEALSQRCRAQAATSERRTSCPPSGHPAPRHGCPSACVPGLSSPVGQGRVGAGTARSWVLGKVTAGQCSPYLTLAPPLPHAWGCSCLRALPPCSQQLWFRF